MALAYKPNGKRWELGLRAAIVVALCAALAIEWVHAPNATIFLGPFYFAWYGHDAASYAIAGVLWIALISPAVKPCIVTACVSVVTFPLWLFLGLIGKGIGC
jgi:hypothetical protein